MVWYRPGRYFWRGPKKGIEEPDAVEIKRGPCRHAMTPGLDGRFQTCAASCGHVVGPMSLPEARAIAETLRAKLLRGGALTDAERACLVFAK